MIGIEVTQEVKDLNQLSQSVGTIITRSSFPNKWVTDRGITFGYAGATEFHEEDGWHDVVQPAIGDNQKRGSIYFDEVNDVFTYNVIDLTDEEIEQRDQIVMPRSEFKLALLANHGITNDHVQSLFAALAQDPAMVVPVERLKIMWGESEVFKSTTPELFQFADMMDSIAGIDITEQDLRNIFIDYNNGVILD